MKIMFEKNGYIINILRYAIAIFVCLMNIACLSEKPVEGNYIMQNEYPFFQMDTNDMEIFFKKVQTIELGTNVKYVVKLLGYPDEDRNVRDKKRKYLFRELTYYVQQLKANGANEKYDKCVYFYFNESNILIKINSMNINEIKEK